MTVKLITGRRILVGSARAGYKHPLQNHRLADWNIDAVLRNSDRVDDNAPGGPQDPAGLWWRRKHREPRELFARQKQTLKNQYLESVA